MTILEELYFGKINPENAAYHNKNYNASKEQFYRTIEILRSDVSRENRDFLEQLSLEHRQMELEHGKEMFRMGFSLAIKLCAEAFSSSEKPTYPALSERNNKSRFHADVKSAFLLI